LDQAIAEEKKNISALERAKGLMPPHNNPADVKPVSFRKVFQRYSDHGQGLKNLKLKKTDDRYDGYKQVEGDVAHLRKAYSKIVEKIHDDATVEDLQQQARDRIAQHQAALKALNEKETKAEPKKEETKPKTPAPAHQNEPTEKKAAEKPVNSKQAEVFYTPLKNIHTDTERFQPRGTDYSKESKDKIVNNFDDNRLDPVVLYREKGKDYVLSGHSRLAAHEELDKLPDTDPRKQAATQKGFQPGQIKARYFQGSEKEAIEFADRSNDLGTKNKDYESAASLRRMREAGKSKREIQDRAKEDFGKNWRYIYLMSYLNPSGKIMTTLQQFENNPDKDGQNRLEKAAQWVGAVRERMGELITNQHENEMFDYLMDKTRSTKLDRENDFIATIQNITGRFDFNRDEPLNLNRIKNKSAGEISHDAEEGEIKQAIKEKQQELDNLNDRLNNPKNPGFVNPKASDYADVLKNAEKKKTALNGELTALRKELLTHQQNKGKVLADNMSQFGLFDMNNLTPAEVTQTNEELKQDGITVQDIENYEKSLSNPAELSPSGADHTDQAGEIPSNVRPSTNDQGTGTQQNPGSSTVQGTEPVDPELQAKIDKKNAALQKFRKTLGKLNSGLDPEAIAAGAELMAAYADLGIYKLKALVKDAIDVVGREFFQKKENVDALKGAYAYYRQNLPKGERSKMDNEDQVDEFSGE
jgi:hypothetical protein